MIIGFDCATHTGWAVVDNSGKYVDSGVQDFSKRRGESNGIMFLRFRQWLKEFVALIVHTTKDNDSVVIYFERAHNRGGAPTEIGYNLTGRIQEFCAENSIEFRAVHTGELKKWATGHGNADKQMMKDKAAEWLGRPPISDDEADALCLAMFGAYEVGGVLAAPSKPVATVTFRRRG